MTEQEILDKVATHLLTQGKPAKLHPELNSEACAYRSPDGLKCALGCLIPDDVYDPEMETQPVHSLFSEGNSFYAIFERLGLLEHKSILISLQGVHDRHIAKNWPDGLRKVAREYGLSSQAVDSFEAKGDS